MIDLAGEGIPQAIWRYYAPASQDSIAFGAERAAIGSGNFSWRNVRLARQGESIAGMALAYRLPDGEPDFLDLHPLEVPLVTLEARVPGTFYTNALAVYPEAQRRGVGQCLMEEAHRRVHAAGCTRASLIVRAQSEYPLSHAVPRRGGQGSRVFIRYIPVPPPAGQPSAVQIGNPADLSLHAGVAARAGDTGQAGQGQSA